MNDKSRNKKMYYEFNRERFSFHFLLVKKVSIKYIFTYYIQVVVLFVVGFKLMNANNTSLK